MTWKSNSLIRHNFTIYATYGSQCQCYIVSQSKYSSWRSGYPHRTQSSQQSSFIASRLQETLLSNNLKSYGSFLRVVACVTFDAHHSKELKPKLSTRQGCMCVGNDSFRVMHSSGFRTTNGIFNPLHLWCRLSFWARMIWNASVTQAGPKHICGKIPTSNSQVLTLQVWANKACTSYFGHDKIIRHSNFRSNHDFFKKRGGGARNSK